MNLYQFVILVTLSLFSVGAFSFDKDQFEKKFIPLAEAISRDKDCRIEVIVENKKSKVESRSIWFWATIKNKSKVLDILFLSATYSVKEKGRTFSGEMVVANQPDHGEESRFEKFIETDQDGPYGQVNDKIEFKSFKIKKLKVAHSKTGAELFMDNGEFKDYFDDCIFDVKYTLK